MKKKGWDCNRDGCPGMAHPCTRISVWDAEQLLKGWEHGGKVSDAFRLQARGYESEIAKLKDELLAAYRRIG